MKIAEVGCGYVGLATGACLADTGNDVIRVDTLTARAVILDGRNLHSPGAMRAHGFEHCSVGRRPVTPEAA